MILSTLFQVQIYIGSWECYCGSCVDNRLFQGTTLAFAFRIWGKPRTAGSEMRSMWVRYLPKKSAEHYRYIDPNRQRIERKEKGKRDRKNKAKRQGLVRWDKQRCFNLERSRYAGQECCFVFNGHLSLSFVARGSYVLWLWSEQWRMDETKFTPSWVRTSRGRPKNRSESQRPFNG